MSFSSIVINSDGYGSSFSSVSLFFCLFSPVLLLRVCEIYVLVERYNNAIKLQLTVPD